MDRTDQASAQAGQGHHRVVHAVDRMACADPSPEALREYRRTSRELAEAQRAFALAAGH